MNEDLAREELKIWAAKPLPRNSHEERTEADSRMKIKHFLTELAEKATKKYGIAAALLAAFLLYGWAIAAWTEHRVTKEVTEAVTIQLRGDFQRYLAEQENARMAAGLVTGDASKQAAMEAEADAIARLLYGYRDNSLRDRRTLIWCVLARTDSPAYPNTVEAVVDQAQQWMFYKPDNPIRDDDRNLALEQLQAWHDGRYPAGISADFVYAEWSAHDIALRNEYKTGSTTKYWRFPE